MKFRAIDNTIARKRRCLSHLRRVIQPEELPPDSPCSVVPSASRSVECGRPSLQHSCLEGNEVSTSQIAPRSNPQKSSPAVLCVLLCQSSLLTEQCIHAILSSTNVSNERKSVNDLFIIKVPLLDPVSAEEAAKWSQKYWPTIYRKQNTLGPQHNIVHDAQREIERTTGAYMDLAREVGRAASTSGLGKPVGAVVVDRSKQPNGVVLAAAGDARRRDSLVDEKFTNGNAMAHSVMRAIAMIAHKTKTNGQLVLDDSSIATDEAFFASLPLTDLEKLVYGQATVEPDAYLCLDLDFYVTHEPCLMCTMALLHSRVGRIVFGTQMTSSGGLLAERDRSASHQGLEYGLFWRSELNWKCLVWQWIGKEDSTDVLSQEAWHA